MSYEESNERKRSRQSFRTILDVGMGIFYVVIGALVLLFKSFGTLQIPPVIAYILGGMMVIGGGFRFYRGLKIIMGKDN